MEERLNQQVLIKVGATIVGISTTEEAYLLSPEFNPLNAIVVHKDYVDKGEEPETINDHSEMLERALKGEWKMSDGTVKNFHGK